MGKTQEKVTIQIPKDIVEKIAELNNVNEKYINRTIIRILKDEIDMENKIKDLKKVK